MDRRAHWQRIYRTRDPSEANGFPRKATVSLGLIASVSLDPDVPIIDVGGGASVLVDDLLALGFRAITVLDVSEEALAHSRARLGPAAHRVQWIPGDVTNVHLEAGRYGLWHDRAVLHFLTDPGDRALYVRQLRHALSPDGVVLIAASAPDGPATCSGLPVARYGIDQMRALLGAGFRLVGETREACRTPSGQEQSFQYGLFRRLGGAPDGDRLRRASDVAGREER